MMAAAQHVRARGARSKRPALSNSCEGPGITSELFARFQALIYEQAGIWLASHKTALLTGRLARRLRMLGLGSMAEYYGLVTQPDQQHERAVMIDCITTNETHFFREPRHFEVLAQRIFPRWKEQAAAGERTKHVRIWSAGCSTGEEPYSLAMLMLKYFAGESGWELEVLATDISTRVLETARAAIFRIEKSKEIPADYLHSYMLKGTADQEGFMKTAPEVQRLVRFSRVNLHADSYPFSGSFDLIFCRNVLIYFDLDSKKKVIAGLMRHLAPAGLLFVGHSENLNGITPGLKSVMPTVYAIAGQDGKPEHHASAREFVGDGRF